MTTSRRIIRVDEVQHITGLKKTAIYRLICDGKFPASFRIAGTKAVGWDSLAVQAWIDGQFDDRKSA